MPEWKDMAVIHVFKMRSVQVKQQVRTQLEHCYHKFIWPTVKRWYLRGDGMVSNRSARSWVIHVFKIRSVQVVVEVAEPL